MRRKRIEHTVTKDAEGQRIYEIAGLGPLRLRSVTGTIGILNKRYLNLHRERLGTEAADRERDETSEIGRMVHDSIKRLCGGKPYGDYEWRRLGYPLPKNDEVVADERVRNGVRAYKRFKNETGYEPVVAELFVYSLMYGLAGTADNIGLLPRDGKKLLAILDWKTGDDLYDEVWMQLSAYAVGFAECYGRYPDLVLPVRLDRTTGLPVYGKGMVQREYLEAFTAFRGLQRAADWLEQMRAN